MSKETVGPAAGMRAAGDAIALVRAYLACDHEAASRLIETPNAWVLAADLAYMTAYLLRQLPEPLREEYFARMLTDVRDNVLDVRLAEGPANRPETPDGMSG